MEMIKSVDEKVMEIFDKEFQEMRDKIFEQVEDLYLVGGHGIFDETLFNQYECYYTELITKQLKGAGTFPKELELSNPPQPIWLEDRDEKGYW